MVMIVEDGTGVNGANSYSTEAEVTAYLTDRNRQTENGWSTALTTTKSAAIIAATDFIERRWGIRFKGSKEFVDISAARATLTFADQPADTETIVLGTKTYTFNTALGGANSVLIGANVNASIDNLINAILAVANEAGVTHGIGTTANTDASAVDGVGDTMIASALVKGTAGNSVISTTTVVQASWSSTTLVGGGDIPEPQPLSFPRISLVDRDGVYVRGIPDKLKFATAEYAVRAISSSITLMPDPTYDDSGKAINRKKEKVGPIETDITYEEGGSTSNILRAYPTADKLLSDYVMSAGGVIRA